MSPRTPGLAEARTLVARDGTARVPGVSRRATARKGAGAVASDAVPSSATPGEQATTLERGRRWMRVRMALLCVLLLAGAAAVLARAYTLQIVQGDEHRATAESQ